MKYLKKKLAILAIMAAGVLAANATEIPDFINLEVNKIDMNGADWSALRTKLANTGDSTFRILHIGDSHIQAEMVTNELRRILQECYGNAGRGLVSPMKLAGTNQPVDFTITSLYPDSARTQTRLLKRPWPINPGVTGIAESLDRPDRITVKALRPGHDIAKATVLTSSGTHNYEYPANRDSISFDMAPDEALYGVILENGRPGLLYSAIGNNGACYSDYLLIDGFAEATRIFRPDLIILSMGTNEGFSTMTDYEIASTMVQLVRQLQTANPEAQFLILGPMECQRDRNHGHKPLSGIYDINARVAQARNIIGEVADYQGLPYWDFYDVAGGKGSSQLWVDAGLMNPRDHIHLLRPGYELQAELLYRALINALTNN